MGLHDKVFLRLLRERLPARLRVRLAGPPELMAESFVGPSAVRRVLLKRFKRVTAAVDARLAEADVATLERWLETALEARTLRAVSAAP